MLGKRGACVSRPACAEELLLGVQQCLVGYALACPGRRHGFTNGEVCAGRRLYGSSSGGRSCAWMRLASLVNLAATRPED